MTGATTCQLRISTSSGSSRMERRALWRRAGGRDNTGPDSDPPAPRTTAWQRRRYQCPVVKTCWSGQSSSSRRRAESVWSSTRRLRASAPRLLVGQLGIAEPGPGRLPVGAGQELSAELGHPTRDEEHGVAQVDPTDDPAGVQTPAVPGLGGERHLPSLAHLHLTRLRHGALTMQCCSVALYRPLDPLPEGGRSPLAPSARWISRAGSGDILGS